MTDFRADRKSPREKSLTWIGGIIGEDPESGEGGSDDALEYAAPECYSQPEVLSYEGTVDWEIILERAGIPERYRPSWRQYVSGVNVRDLSEAHYKFILRVCRTDPWRSKILASIDEQRTVDPLFGVARPKWNNHLELHRTLNHIGWHPVAQCGVSTISRTVSVSTSSYWKSNDQPGPLTRKIKSRTVQRFVVGCDGFRVNFQGTMLDAYRESVEVGFRYGPSILLHEQSRVDRTALRNFGRVRPEKAPRWWHADSAGWRYGFEPARLSLQRAAAMRYAKRELFPGQSDRERVMGQVTLLPTARFYTWPDRRPVF